MIEKPACERRAEGIQDKGQEEPEREVANRTITDRRTWPNPPKGSMAGPEGTIEEPGVELEALIDVEEIRSIMKDFYQLTNITTAMLDLKGTVIEATGWQDICTKFHRVHPKSSMACTESDLFLAKDLKPGEYIDYKCKNGLWDAVTPLFVGDLHLGNIYAGQFFYDDEQIEESYFIEQPRGTDSTRKPIWKRSGGCRYAAGKPFRI